MCIHVCTIIYIVKGQEKRRLCDFFLIHDEQALENLLTQDENLQKSLGKNTVFSLGQLTFTCVYEINTYLYHALILD